MLNKLKSINYLDLLFGAFFLLIAIHLTRENLQYSNAFTQLPLRSVDDYSFSKILFDMNREFAGGYYTEYFKYFSFGYGNFWWLLNAILVLPFENNPFWYVFLPRLLAQVFALSSLF